MILEYIHDHLRQEVDFVNEGKNAEKADGFVQEDAFLKKNIYIPKVLLIKAKYRCFGSILLKES